MASQDWFDKDFYAVLGVSKDVWMLGVGVEKIHFTCRADTIDDAIGQCRDAFPGRPVASAYAVA